MRPAVALILVAGCGGVAAPEEVAELEGRLAERVRTWIGDGQLARQDGFVYAVDIGQLLIWSAEAEDAELYDALRPTVDTLILQNPDDVTTHGFVAWRLQDGEPPDASGTTEALRVAEGLWRGSAAFNRPADRELAHLVLTGYARHVAVDNGVWFVRNYFNLGTRTFATNSFLVDYGPDLLAEVASSSTQEAREELAEVAARSYALLDRARAPSGLVYAIIQPEVATLMDTSLLVYSPNDVVQLSNSATAALSGVRGEPHVGLGVLGFATSRLPRLDTAYYGRTGEIANRRRPGLETWAVLTRLAVALGDGPSLAKLMPRLVGATEAFLRAEPEPRLYVASELLLGLRAAAK